MIDRQKQIDALDDTCEQVKLLLENQLKNLTKNSTEWDMAYSATVSGLITGCMAVYTPEVEAHILKIDYDSEIAKQVLRHFPQFEEIHKRLVVKFGAVIKNNPERFPDDFGLIR